MRLNKSFVVKRNVTGPRALLAATKLLSQYIRDSVNTGGTRSGSRIVKVGPRTGAISPSPR